MKYILFILFQINFQLFSQSKVIQNIETKVYEYNNAFQYDSSQALINDFLNKENLSFEDKYYANLFKAFTYKRLFDYNSTLKYLNIALENGLKTNKKDFFEKNIICQKAFVHFDIQEYSISDSLMQILSKIKYIHLNDENKSKINMQEAYLLFMNNKLIEAESKYDKAITLMKIESACDLPMIYGKKIELYGKLNRIDKMYESFNLSNKYADSCKIQKYEMYANEMMYKTFEKLNNFEMAYKFFLQFDSLRTIYNNQEHLNKISELEIENESKIKDLKIKLQQDNLFYLEFFLFILAFFFILLIWFYINIRNQRNQIASQNKVNEQMIAILSHDIREPLLGVSLLLKKLHSNDPKISQASISLDRQILSVNSILNNLLKWKKAKNQTNIDNPASLKSTLNQVLNDLNSKIQAKNIQINNSTKDKIINSLQNEELYILIYNLLDNAIKYSFKEGIIHVYEIDNGISIRDFGIGIDVEKIKSLQKEVLTSQKGTYDEIGAGLGLFLIGQILQNKNIKIEFEKLEVGTKVNVLF